MIGAIRSELVKLLRRNTVVGYTLAASGFTVMITVALLLNAENSPGQRDGPRIDLARLTQSDGFIAGFEAASSFLGIMALALFASTIAAEFSTGTIRAVLVADSRRRRVLAGMLTGLTLFLLAMIAFAAIIGSVVAFSLAGSQGVDTAAWFTTDGIVNGLGVMVNVSVALLIWGLFGALFAIISRSAAIAIASGIGYLLIGEQLILHSLWPSTASWLPAGVIAAVAEGGTPAVGYLRAVLFTVGYGMAAYFAATTIFERRDVTD